MHPLLNTTLASSRERELRARAQRPEQLMVRLFELMLKERP